MHIWPKNGKQYPAATTKAPANCVSIVIPVDDILDTYALRDKTYLKNSLRQMTNQDVKAILQSILDETECPIEGDVTVHIYDGTKRPKAAYNPASATEASLVATVLQGKDEKFEAAKAECLKRGIKFTVRQIQVAAKRDRDLTH